MLPVEFALLFGGKFTIFGQWRGWALPIQYFTVGPKPFYLVIDTQVELNLQFCFKTWIQPTVKNHRCHMSMIHISILSPCIYMWVIPSILGIFLVIIHFRLGFSLVFHHPARWKSMEIPSVSRHSQAPALAADGVRERLRRGGDGRRAAAYQAEDASRCGARGKCQGKLSKTYPVN